MDVGPLAADRVMRRFCENVAARIERFTDCLGSAASWLTLVLVLTVCGDVFTRYVLSKSNMAVQELEWHLCAAVFLLCTSWTLRHDRHVRVDVLSTRFSPKVNALVTLLGFATMLLPLVAAMTWTGWPFAMNSWSLRESSGNPGGLPARYVLKFMIPLAALLLLVQGVAMAMRALVVLTGGKEEDPPPKEMS
jgi:TRAP-type mannitol/chloroaromatic compound transport system permease small subunit